MHSFQWRYVGVLAIILATILGSPAYAEQFVHHYKWEVDYYKTLSPDCNETIPKDVLGVHQILPEEIMLNTFPGPTIRAREGDRIEVNVTNKISKINLFGEPERVSIHWHGIRQRGSPWNDGAAGLTECGIPQNGHYTYNFTVDKAGTYIWHGHYHAQRAAGLYGLLIVEQRLGAIIPTYDGEFAITVNDWWHADLYNQTHGLDDYQKWKWVGVPQSFIIKGDSTPCQKYACQSAELECNTSKLKPFNKTGGSGAGKLIWNVLPGKTYLVRIASVTSSAFLNFVIEKHVMTILEADGHLIQPFNTTSIDILSGQTYAFTFTTKPEYPQQMVYHVGVSARDWIPSSKSANGTDPGLAVLSYNSPYINQTVNSSPTIATTLWEYESDIQPGQPPEGPRYNDTEFGYYFANQIRALIGNSYPVPMKENVNLSFVINHIRVIDTEDASRFIMRWTLNNISYNSSETSSPLLARLMSNKETEKPLKQVNSSYFKELDDIFANQTLHRTSEAMRGDYYLLKRGDIVTMILQNSAVYNKTASEAHPWHLHGHDFWVLGYGNGLYDPDTSPRGFNLVDPPVRHTVPVFGRGWVAIRFIADNPGVWSFHCHNEWHVFLGMKVVLVYGIDDIARPTLEELIPQCY